LDGEPRMRERPIGDLVDSLTQLGAKLETANNCPPVKITASGLPGGKTTIAGDISSQFLSGLLMVAPYAQNPIDITLSTELNSKPYIDITIAIMKEFGVKVKRNGYSQFTVHPSSFFPLNSYSIESDASAASYFFAAPAICGGMVKVENISRKSVQGDIAFLDVLSKIGCTITEADNSIIVNCPQG
jgi:3-phosphoshikimate 1-carboxyvinyltransferase